MVDDGTNELDMGGIQVDTLSAFVRGFANRGKEFMVFDWDKAAKLIKERGAMEAGAGLQGDWGWTGGCILSDGKPVNQEETHVYLASTWAIPELEINGEIIPCFKMGSKTPGWDSRTYWPESALSILRGRLASEK